MAKKSRYIILHDAFANAYTFDTKPVRSRRRRLKLTVTWDAFENIPELVRKAGK